MKLIQIIKIIKLWYWLLFYFSNKFLVLLFCFKLDWNCFA